MLKKIILGMVFILIIAIAAGGYAIYSFFPEDDHVATFALNHPDKAAFMLVRNDTVIAQQNIHKKMPLASTVKFIIAIEFAEQASNGTLDTQEKILKSDLLNYYVPNTDGGAHEKWSNSDETLEYGDSIPLQHIAKGMMQYSSNANSEWLMEKLGLVNINKQLEKLQLKDHTEIYPFVSSLFITADLYPDLETEAVVKKANSLSMNEYTIHSLRIHEKLKKDPEYRNQKLDLNEAIQRIWSDRLPAGSVSDYISIMKKLNSKTYFGTTTQVILDDIIETSMVYNSTKEYYEHLGSKGGSTLFVMNMSLYATDKKGNTTEMVYFFNDLNAQERKKLTMSMGDFDRSVLRNPQMVKTINTHYTD